jgi:hypothetical protein
MDFHANRFKNAFQSRERRITARGKSPVQRLPIYTRSQSHLADLMNLRNVAQRQHEHVLGFLRRGIQISRNVVRIS